MYKYKQTRPQATALLFTLDTKLLMCKLVVKYTPEVLLPNQSTLKENMQRRLALLLNNHLCTVLAEAGFCFLGRYFSSIGSYIYCIYSLISDQK